MADLGKDSLQFGRGQRIGKYEILTRLSVGGMAELFLCFSSGAGGFRKFVALKRILPQLQEDEDFVSMFLDEARITASLSHSNIGQVFDLGNEEGELFIAMEFIAGQDVLRILRKYRRSNTRPPVGFTCRIIRDVCLALHYAHHFCDASGRPAPVIHRDVAPKNVMVTYAGNVKVIDFGVAKARGRVSTTKDGQVKGSISYMSPEQIQGHDLDGRSDLFAAGVMLWELLTVSPLFRSATEQETVRQILHEPVVPPETINLEVTTDLSTVVMKALERDPVDRFASGKDMARAIEASCGAEIFDDDQLAAVMRGLFRDEMDKTIALLQSSGSDAAWIREAAGALRTDSSEASMKGNEDVAPTRRIKSGTTPVKEASSAASLTQSPAILAVDDNRTILKFLEQCLVREGFRFTGVGSPLEALRSLVRETFDVIILDVIMPEMDGFELCQRIRQRADLMYVPILFLSSACSVEERVKGLTVGGDDFIRKPYEPAELVARIRMHLHRIRMLQRKAGS
jgi:serine/threonine protein kinase, bacterial